MAYIENPKTRGSGVVCCIPQKGTCPIGCEDCFFQSGRSFLEPLEEHTPNMPSDEQAAGRVVRVNDGNDSSHQRELVLRETARYEHKFFNTSIPRDLAGFNAPVVLTVNPGRMTDERAHLLDEIPSNLMMVRFRSNTWNTGLCDTVVQHYAIERKVPVVLTFLAFYTTPIPEEHQRFYMYRKRTLNRYWVINQLGWDIILDNYADEPYVYACGKNATTHACARCGTCLREYHATCERMLARGGG